MTNTKVVEIQELRRSEKAQPIPAKKVRREVSRQNRNRADIYRSIRGE